MKISIGYITVSNLTYRFIRKYVKDCHCKQYKEFTYDISITLYKQHTTTSFNFFTTSIMDYTSSSVSVCSNNTTPCEIDSYQYEHSICSDHSIHTERSFEKRQKDGSGSSIHTIKRKYNGKNKKINIFNTTNMINAPIVNAVTGFVFIDENMLPYRVGSMNELLFYKVKLLTGENGIPAVTLFYDTPEQYEKHLSETISQKTKSEYIERRNDYVTKKRIQGIKKRSSTKIVIH